MGLDVNLYAEVSPTPEELAVAEEFFTDRSHLADPDYNEGRSLAYDDSEWHGRPRVNVYTLSRYYGVGYERGDWPSIYAAIRVLREAFPGAKVFYGSDSSDDGTECTEEFLEELWSHYLGPRGLAYRERR